jgi:hypothetical protein
MTGRSLTLFAFLICLLMSAAQAQSNTLSASQESDRQLTAEEVLARVARAVFVVETRDPSGTLLSTGTGVFVARRTYEWREGLGGTIKSPDNLWVVTNKHVVDFNEYSVLSNAIRVREGETLRTLWRAEAVRNTPYDVAFVNVFPNPEIDAPPVSVRESPPAVGEHVYVVGGNTGRNIAEATIATLDPEQDVGELKMKGSPSLGPNGSAIFDQYGKLLGITSPWGAKQDFSFAAVCSDMVNVFSQRMAEYGQQEPAMDFSGGCAGRPQFVRHWYWSQDCRGNAKLGLQVRVDGNLVYSGELPICMLAGRTGSKEREQISFAFKGGHLFQRKYQTTAEQTILGSISQVASSVSDLTLQISFSGNDQSDLFHYEIPFRQGIPSVSIVDSGIVINTTSLLKPEPITLDKCP